MTNPERISEYHARFADHVGMLSPDEAAVAWLDFYHRADKGTRYQQHVLWANRRFRATILTLRRNTK